MLLRKTSCGQTKLLGKTTRDNLSLKRSGLIEEKDPKRIRKEVKPKTKVKMLE